MWVNPFNYAMALLSLSVSCVTKSWFFSPAVGSRNGHMPTVNSNPESSFLYTWSSIVYSIPLPIGHPFQRSIKNAMSDILERHSRACFGPVGTWVAAISYLRVEVKERYPCKMLDLRHHAQL